MDDFGSLKDISDVENHIYEFPYQRLEFIGSVYSNFVTQKRIFCNNFGNNF